MLSTAALVAAVGAALLAACGAPERAAPPPPAATATLALPDPAPMSSASSAPVANPKASASASARAPAPPPPPVSDPDSFACGETRCRSGIETCCANGSEGHCLSSVSDGEVNTIGYLATQWEQCQQLQFKRTGSFDRMSRCDESVDCEPNHVCCEQFLFSGSRGLAECNPLPRSGETPCDFGERCIEGSPCRTPGTDCVSGMCRKKLAERPCGPDKCSGDTPVCCASPLGCVAEGACGNAKLLLCTSHADCVKGEKCVATGFGGTSCEKAVVHPDYTPYLCKQDRDCPNPCTSMPGTKAACVEASIPWLGYCQCLDVSP